MAMLLLILTLLLWRFFFSINRDRVDKISIKVHNRGVMVDIQIKLSCLFKMDQKKRKSLDRIVTLAGAKADRVLRCRIYHTPGKHANHNTTFAVQLL
jgi:hypothetical protein